MIGTSVVGHPIDRTAVGRGVYDLFVYGHTGATVWGLAVTAGHLAGKDDWGGNLTALLVVFELNGWVRHLREAFPAIPGESRFRRQQRLRQAVKNLNKGLRPGTLRFRGDGSGHGVKWEPCELDG
jgi:hypothetical protein